MKIGYVLNTYPAPSHSFIRREIRALERRGVVVQRIAMRSHSGALVDPGDREEAARTEHVLAQGAVALARAVMAEALGRPRRFGAALGAALRIGARSEVGRLRHLIYLAEAAWLRRRAAALGLEHLHAHFGTNPAAVARLTRALGGPGYSFTVHGPEEFDAPRALALDEKAAAAAFVVAISSFGRSQLCRWVDPAHWSRLQVVPCGIEPDRFETPAPLPDRAPGTPLRLAVIGRLSEQKGQLLLVDALAAALRHPGLPSGGVHLTLLGDGPLRAPIEAALRAQGLDQAVTLAGWVDEARVRAELAAAHALVLPSFAEGLPMVVMEAMASARPVIATSIAGIPELMRAGETGWLVPAGDAGALADALVEAACTPKESLSAMGQAGRSRVLARHDIDHAAARLEHLFRAAIAG